MDISNLDSDLYERLQLITSTNSPLDVYNGLSILFKLLKNIQDTPTEAKFKNIKKSNKVIATKLLCLQNISDVLHLIGYVDKDDDNLEYRGDQESLDIVMTILEVHNVELEETVKTPEERERERKIREEEEASKKFVDDFHAEQVNNALANIIGQTLRSKQGNIQTSSIKEKKYILFYFSAH